MGWVFKMKYSPDFSFFNPLTFLDIAFSMKQAPNE